MPLFLIERNYAKRLAVTIDGDAAVNEVHDQESLRWLISFLSIDKKRDFRLYEAPTAEAMIKVAERAGVPASAIIEVAEEILPNESAK